MSFTDLMREADPARITAPATPRRREEILGTRQLIIDPEIGQLIGERERPTDDPYADRNLGTAYTRVLVDAVPAELAAEAEHVECFIAEDNATNCPF